MENGSFIQEALLKCFCISLVSEYRFFGGLGLKRSYEIVSIVGELLVPSHWRKNKKMIQTVLKKKK